MKHKIYIKNRKAGFTYFLLEKFTAGIALTGTEIKSIRAGKVSLGEAFCVFQAHELFVRDMHIAEYTFGNYHNHEPKRDRKLLLKARELKKLRTKFNEKGLAIIPVALFVNEKGLAKLEVALAKGKHHYDKRESLKKKDMKREMDRQTKF